MQRSKNKSGQQQVLNINIGSGITPKVNNVETSQPKRRKLSQPPPSKKRATQSKSYETELKQAVNKYESSKKRAVGKDVPNDLLTIPPKLLAAKTPAGINKLSGWLDEASDKIDKSGFGLSGKPGQGFGNPKRPVFGSKAPGNFSSGGGASAGYNNLTPMEQNALYMNKILAQGPAQRNGDFGPSLNRGQQWNPQTNSYDPPGGAVIPPSNPMTAPTVGGVVRDAFGWVKEDKDAQAAIVGTLAAVTGVTSPIATAILGALYAFTRSDTAGILYNEILMDLENYKWTTRTWPITQAGAEPYYSAIIAGAIAGEMAAYSNGQGVPYLSSTRAIGNKVAIDGNARLNQIVATGTLGLTTMPPTGTPLPSDLQVAQQVMAAAALGGAMETRRITSQEMLAKKVQTAVYDAGMYKFNNPDAQPPPPPTGQPTGNPTPQPNAPPTNTPTPNVPPTNTPTSQQEQPVTVPPVDRDTPADAPPDKPKPEEEDPDSTNLIPSIPSGVPADLLKAAIQVAADKAIELGAARTVGQPVTAPSLSSTALVTMGSQPTYTPEEVNHILQSMTKKIPFSNEKKNQVAKAGVDFIESKGYTTAALPAMYSLNPLNAPNEMPTGPFTQDEAKEALNTAVMYIVNNGWFMKDKYYFASEVKGSQILVNAAEEVLRQNSITPQTKEIWRGVLWKAIAAACNAYKTTMMRNMPEQAFQVRLDAANKAIKYLIEYHKREIPITHANDDSITGYNADDFGVEKKVITVGSNTRNDGQM